MIRHHRRALIVPSSHLTPSDAPPAWADQVRGMGRRRYDSWAACLPSLSEEPAPGQPDGGDVAGEPTPPAAAAPGD